MYQEQKSPLDWLKMAIESSGASDRSFATDILGRDERTVRRWLAEESPVPDALTPMLRVLAEGAVQYKGHTIMPRPMRLRDGGWSAVVHVLQGNEVTPMYGQRELPTKAEAVAFVVEMARQVIDGTLVPRPAPLHQEGA